MYITISQYFKRYIFYNIIYNVLKYYIYYNNIYITILYVLQYYNILQYCYNCSNLLLVIVVVINF